MRSPQSLLAALALACAACRATPTWTVTDISARVGTVVDLHGRTGINTLPA